MKNLKAQFKLIIFFLICLNVFNILSAKNIDKFSSSKDLSNYFSGVMAINDNQYQTSYNYFKLLDKLEESHYSYSQYYLYSLISLKKFKNAAKYSKELEKKKLDSFESNLVAGIYHLENKDFDQAKIYFKKLENQSQTGTIQDLLSTSLNAWINFKDINSALVGLESFPSAFNNIKNIQEVFLYCYFDSNQTDEAFNKLTTDPKINYSRYHYFHASYLISKKKEKKAEDLLKSSLKTYPTNLILNQLLTDLNRGQKIGDQFDCKKSNHVIAEIIYIIANGLSSRSDYTASNFYLNLAKYLNPKFLSFETLHAENFEVMEKYPEAIKI